MSPIRPRVQVTPDLSALLDIWSVWSRGAGLAERTIEDRRGALERLAARTGADPVTAGAETLAAFLAAAPSTATRRSYYSHARAWYRWLVLTERRVDDPTMLLGKPRVPRGRPRPLTLAQLEQLLATRMHRRTRMMILLGAYAGLRVHEIAKVRGEDLNTVAGALRVVGKGGVERVVPVHARILGEADRFPTCGWWFPTWKPNTAYPQGGGHVLARSVSSIIKGVMERAGVPGTPHALRHFFGTEVLRAAKGNLRVTQELMGHASISSTAIYTEVDDTDRRAAVAGLPGHESPTPRAPAIAVAAQEEPCPVQPAAPVRRSGICSHCGGAARTYSEGSPYGVPSGWVCSKCVRVAVRRWRAEKRQALGLTPRGAPRLRIVGGQE